MSRGSEQLVVVAPDRRSATGGQVTAIAGESVLEVPDADPQAVRGEGLAIRRRIGDGEARVEGDECEDEGLEGSVQDGEHGEFWVLRERGRSREPVEVQGERGILVADHDAS
jgi:hypothetical protein